MARTALALAAAAVVIGGHRATAQSAWDPVPGLGGQADGSVSGGSGTWDLLTPNWTSDGGLTDAVWVNGSAAVFGGTSGGVVTLVNGGVTAGGLTFNPTPSGTTYTLQGQAPTDVLALSAPQVTANADATINATLGGSVGLTKLGAGTLTVGGSNTFSGAVTIAAGRLRVASITNLGAASSLSLAGGALDATGPLTFVGPVSVGTSGGSIFLSAPASVVTLAGVLSGNGPLTIDGTGGGSLAVTGAANLNGSGNTFTGNVSLVGGGSASLAYTIAAPAGQVFSASGGTLTLGGSVSGATVSLAAGSTAQAFNTGVLRLTGRSSGPGVGVSVGGDLVASAGGRIEVGDGLDDSAQVRLLNTAHLTADNGTIVLRPRVAALTLDATTVSSLAVRNGGVLALGAGATGDLVIGSDVNQAGAWTLANQSGQALRVRGGSQDSTAGLTLRAEGGLTRYEVDTINLGSAAANGTIGVDLRGGTIDINNAAAGKTFTYSPGYVVSGWGQLGTSAANQTQVISAGGATFYANGPAASGATLSVVGGFNESAGGKASFRIANNNGLSLTVPNATAATAYVLGNAAVTIDPQSAGSVARLVVNGGAVQANAGAFVNPANKVRFDVLNGGTLVSDISGTGTLLVTGSGAAPINLSGGATFATTSPTFTLKAGETIGGSGTLFTPSTNLTLNGTLALVGTLGATVNGASTGSIRMNAGDTLTMTAGGDLLSTALSYGGTSAAAATLEVNAPASTVRLGTGGAVTNDGGFAGSREFRVTAGTFQADAADATTVTIDGANQLSVDRTANGVADRTLLGTLTLNGGAFQVGTTAATSTVLAGATLSGRGTFGHATAIDTVVNLGTVQAQGGQLNVNAAAVKGGGTWDPNGQILALTGSIQDVGTGNPTQFRIAGANGGRVQVAQAGSYSGGTVVDGSASANGIALRVSATNGTSTPLGGGPITLNSAALQLISDVGVNLSGNGVTVQGSGGTLIQYDRAGTATSSQTHRLGSLTVGGQGQTVTLQGPTTTAYVHTLTLGSVTVTPAGATIVQQGANPVNFGNLTLNGNLALTLASTNFSVNALDGSGTLSRTVPSGTLNFKTAAAPTFTGKLVTSVGTTNFSASNVLAGGSYLITNSGATTGTVNVTTAGALNLASGTMAAGQFNLTVGGSLDGTNLNLTGGNVSANVANALGTGTLQLGGGNLFLRSNANTAFGGTLVAANGTAVTNVTVDHANGGNTTGGNHTVAGMGLVDRQLNLIQANGYTLGVTGATTVGGTGVSTLDNEISQLSLASLQLNSGQLLLTGAGNTSIGQMGGTGSFRLSTLGAVTITGPSAPGFAGSVLVSNGTLNLNDPAALSGGTLTVSGGVLNLGGSVTGVPITLASGFVNANVANAFGGAPVSVTNGTLVASASNALGGSTINMAGGNVTATAPNALGTAQVNLTNAALALRSDTAAAFGGNVNVGGTNFSTISVAKLTDGGGTGNRLSINSLTFGGQTLNITGADNDVFAVVNPVTISGTAATTINTTAADAVFQGALSGSGPLTKSGVRTLTLDGGGNVGAVTVNAGTLAVNNVLTTPSVTVGGASAATLQIGGSGANNIGALAVNSGTLRFARADASTALPAALGITAGASGDVTLEYTGLSDGRVANAVTVDTSLAARKLTLAARSGTAAGQVGSFTFSGLIGSSGANALTIVAQADSTLTDAQGNLLRSPSRMILAGAQTFTSDLQHGGGIVIGKGTVPASGAGPLGAGTNPLQLTVMDSSVGGMVLDGQGSTTFSKAVTTATGGGPRARLGAYYNPAGSAFQTVNFNGSFAWNDASVPLVVVPAPGVVGGAAGASLWNGLYADPGTILQVNNGAVLDNVITSTSTAVTSTAPVYAGGGGTVRLNSNFGDAGYRNLTTATGLAGTLTVLDDTTVQSFTAGHHFDAVDLRTGTYQVGNVNQLLSGGFTVNASPFDATRATGNLVTDFNLALGGTGSGKAFGIAAGQTLTKSGAAALTVTGDQAHAAGSTLAVTGGTVNLNTDAGMNATGGAPSNKLSLTAGNAAATVNLNVTQHLAQVTATSGLIKVAAGTTNGSRVLDVTGVAVTGGQLDLTNNRLIVDYTDSSPINSIRQQLAAGFAGGAWTGAGIITSSAQIDRTLALGFGESSELLGAGGGTFGSETVDATSVLVRLTKAGDANLDGTINFSDLLALAKNYNAAGTTWTKGDFNYDGTVNFGDLLTLAKNYNSVAPSEPIPGASATFEADLAAAFAVAVPEPTTVGAVALLATGALLRRRRRRRRA